MNTAVGQSKEFLTRFKSYCVRRADAIMITWVTYVIYFVNI